MVKVKNYKKHLLEQLQNPQEALAYLNAALDNGDFHIILLAVRDFIEARGYSLCL